MTAVDIRWVVFVDVADRSGALTAMTECFATRGVSFESVNTLDVHDGRGALSFLFGGSERMARVLARTVERLTAVSRVRLERADDPRVRALAQVEGVAGPLATTVLARTGDGSIVLAGSLAEVEAGLAEARAAGATRVVRTVIPPAD